MEPLVVEQDQDPQEQTSPLRRVACICCCGVLGIVVLLASFVVYTVATLQQPSCPQPGDDIRVLPPVDPQPTYSYTTCMEYYGESDKSDPAEWCRGGKYFTFKSGAGKNMDTTGGAGVQIWWRCDGNSSDPQVLFVHGYPTSSWDTWAPTSELLQNSHYVCHVDHQGFGFSDKPQAPYFYSIFEHAAALNQFVTTVAELSNFTMLTHDMGNSVGFAFLQKFYNPATRIVNNTFTVNHHFFTNGNVWLPLAQLSTGQLLLLDNRTGPFFTEQLTDAGFAAGIAHLFFPPLSQEKQDLIAGIFGYQDGTKNQDDLIQYLQQRACYEQEWLDALTDSQAPATMVWGDADPVAPLAVSDYVWEHSLSTRPATANYIKVAKESHFIPHDVPSLYACLVRNLDSVDTCLNECRDGCTLVERS